MKIMEKHSLPIKVGIVGARGYSGQELCRLLLNHANVSLDYVFYNEGKPFSLWSQFSELERLAKSRQKPEPIGLELEAFFLAEDEKLDVVFLATPNEVSLELAGRFLKKGISVLDLSGVFRLNKVDLKSSTELYYKYYGLDHKQPDLLALAVYGLHPFGQKEVASINVKNPFLIANPGCYVTSALMALVPLLADGLIESTSVIIDAKSGASGAGKKLNESLLFSELYGDFYPYKVLNHQHTPEIEMYLKFFTGHPSSVVFTPHLLPIFRGILSTCYLKWSGSLKSKSIEEKKALVQSSYSKAFQNYALVEWGELKSMQKKMSLKAVAQSCMTHIAYELNADHLIVFSAIDNLLKGAASQAVENLNRIYGFQPQESLV